MEAESRGSEVRTSCGIHGKETKMAARAYEAEAHVHRVDRVGQKVLENQKEVKMAARANGAEAHGHRRQPEQDGRSEGWP